MRTMVYWVRKVEDNNVVEHARMKINSLHEHVLMIYGTIRQIYRDVFRIQSNIYDEAFLWKYLTALSCQLF